MLCSTCGTEMVISEWDGWVWVCFICDNIGRPATTEEIEELERSYPMPGDRVFGEPGVSLFGDHEV